MPSQNIELPLINRVTIETVGPPGQRVFLLQAEDAIDTITLKMEKEQARALAHKSLELLDSLMDDYPDLPPASQNQPGPIDLQLTTPAEPLFAVGQIGLGYDAGQDKVILALQELTLDELQEASTAQLWVSRPQLKALSEHALSIVDQGRPNCPLCGEPIDPAGHFCPRRNGHDKQHVQ